MDLGSLSASLTLDSSGFQDGLSAASSALTSFASVAGGAFAGIEGAMATNAIGQSLTDLGGFVVSTASQFQDFSTTAGFSLTDTAENYDAALASFSNGAAATSGASAAAADALAKYQEKVATIQQNIADVMSGQNITDAISKYNDTLISDQEAYADKVSQINDQIQQAQQDLLTAEQDNAQKMQDTLANMADSHANKIADTKEKQAVQIANATSATEKVALEKKFNQENRLSQDSYQRQYNMKKVELQRSLDEENERAKDAADKKVATLQAQLAKEANLEAEKEAKLKAQEDNEIKRLEAANAKKLALYQRELIDEERSFKESQAKRSGGGGHGAGVAGAIQIAGRASGEWGTVGEKVSDVDKLVEKLSQNSPFTKMELQETAVNAGRIGFNFTALGQTLTDLGAAKGKSPLEALNAVIMATHGRTVQLRTAFGITGDALNMALGKAAGNTKFTMNEVLEGITKVNKDMGNAGAAKAMSQTYQGELMKVRNSLSDVALQIMGVDLSAKNPVEKGGLLDSLQKGAASLAQFLSSHRTQIADMAKEFIKAFTEIAKVVGQVAGFIIDHWGVIGPILLTVGLAFGVIIPIVSALFEAFVVISSVFGTFITIGEAVAFVIAAITSPILLVGIAIAALAAAFIFYPKQMQAAITSVVGFIIAVFKNLFLWLTPAGWLVLGIMAVRDNWTAVLAVVHAAVAVFVDLLQGHWGKLMVDLKKLLSDIIALFSGLAKTFEDWGTNLAKAFVDGFMKMLNSLKDKIGGALSAVTKFIKGGSPPEEGPLKEIDVWGHNVGMAWVNSFQKALSTMQMPSDLASGLGGGGTLNYNTQSNLRTSNVTMNNNFQIAGQGSAQNMVEYLAFQSNHFGVV